MAWVAFGLCCVGTLVIVMVAAINWGTSAARAFGTIMYSGLRCFGVELRCSWLVGLFWGLVRCFVRLCLIGVLLRVTVSG